LRRVSSAVRAMPSVYVSNFLLDNCAAAPHYVSKKLPT
jgi:hypothetical protein